MGKTVTAAAPGGSPVPFADLEGKLLVVEPLSLETGITTVHSKERGDTDAVRANVWVVRSKDGSKFDEYEDTLIFPRVLIGQLRKAIGKSVVVGRLIKDTENQKRGQNPPWKLAEPSAADLKVGAEFYAARSMSGAGADEDYDSDDEFGGDDEDAF